MKTGMTITVLLALSATMVAPAEAQRRGNRGAAGMRPVRTEQVLGMRARLTLTDDQIAQLGTIREEDVQRRQADMASMMEMVSRLRAGEITRDEFLANRDEHFEAGRAVMTAETERIEAILTDEQREQARATAGRQTGQRGFIRGGGRLRGDQRGFTRGGGRGQAGFRRDGGRRGRPSLGPRGRANNRDFPDRRFRRGGNQ